LRDRSVLEPVCQLESDRVSRDPGRVRPEGARAPGGVVGVVGGIPFRTLCAQEPPACLCAHQPAHVGHRRKGPHRDRRARSLSGGGTLRLRCLPQGSSYAGARPCPARLSTSRTTASSANSIVLG
jgi:hypothetical protein